MDDDIKKDEEAILKEAGGLLKDPGKRRLLGNVLTLGSLSLVTGVTLEHYGNWIKETQRLAEDVSRDANAKMMAKVTALRNHTKTDRTNCDQ